jgi:hypothetical protein
MAQLTDTLVDGDLTVTGTIFGPDGEPIDLADAFGLDAATELTIASGAVTRSGNNHTIDTEGDASTDDLDTVSGGTEGDLLLLRAEHTDRTVVLKDGTGNLDLGADITLDDTLKSVLLVLGATNWTVVATSGFDEAAPGEFAQVVVTDGVKSGTFAPDILNFVGGDGAAMIAVKEFLRIFITDPTFTMVMRLSSDGVLVSSLNVGSEASNTRFDAVRVAMKLLGRFLGAGDGVFAYGAVGTDSYKTQATDPVSMTVEVLEGIGSRSDQFFELAADWTSATLSAPSADPRIDTVSANETTGAITITTGSEASSPSAPATPAGHVKLAEIFHRVGESSIKDADDASNGYITLKRNRLNFGGQE